MIVCLNLYLYFQTTSCGFQKTALNNLCYFCLLFLSLKAVASLTAGAIASRHHMSVGSAKEAPFSPFSPGTAEDGECVFVLFVLK